MALLQDGCIVAYFVPAEAVDHDAPRYATREEVMEYLERTRAKSQLVLDWLKDH